MKVVNHIKFYRMIILSCILFCNLQFFAQVNSIKISFDKDSALIGDYLQLHMEASYKNGEVYFPLLKDSLGNGFEVIEKGTEKKSTVADNYKKSITYKLIQFDEGMYQFAQLPVLFKNNNGKLDTINSNRFQIFVKTIPVDTLQEIKPIKSIVFPKYEWKEFIPLILATLIVVLLIVMLVYLFIKYSAKATITKVLTIDDIYKNTIMELEKLKASQLWKTTETKEHHLKLSDLLRTYLESRFEMLALESTTQEIMAVIYEKQAIDENAKELLNQILIHCDFVKFAKWKPDEESAEKIMNDTILLVHKLKPIVLKKEEESK